MDQDFLTKKPSASEIQHSPSAFILALLGIYSSVGKACLNAGVLGPYYTPTRNQNPFLVTKLLGNIVDPSYV